MTPFSKDDAERLRGILADVREWPHLWHHAPFLDRARVFLTEQFSATSATPPTPVAGETADMEEEIDRLRRMLKTATIRLGILRDRTEACAEAGGYHQVSLDEVPAWIEEQEAFLATRGAGAEP